MKSKLTKLAVALGAVGLMAGAKAGPAQGQGKIRYISDLPRL